jgi:hypothetical protein
MTNEPDDSLGHFPQAVLNYGEYLVAYSGWVESDVARLHGQAEATPAAEQTKTLPDL